MFVKAIIFIVGSSALLFGCIDQPSDLPSETQEITDNLVRAGFPADDIRVVSGVVYVGNDAAVTLQASREMLQTGSSSKEQYRTTNLVSTSLRNICINAPAFTGVFSTALDLAIANYNDLSLTFKCWRIPFPCPCPPPPPCDFTINANISGPTGGSSGFPSGGLPFGTINIGSGLSTFSVDTVEHVITHEIGHTIGLRHSDFFNRAISCGGAASNEGSSSVGAILIPGTPSGATVGGSLMNSCFRTNETGEFTSSDITALTFLY